MSQRQLFFVLSLFLLALFSCDSGNDNDFVPPSTATATAVITSPSGADLSTGNGSNYSFMLTISGVNGPLGGGQFSAVLSNATGTLDISGLTVLFSGMTQTGTNTYTVQGVLSGPFEGQGTVDITVTYTEAGVIVSNNSVTFTVSVLSFAFCDLELTFLDRPEYAVPTATITGGPTNISDVNVLVDVGLNFNAEIQMILTSPSGTAVTLVDFENIDVVVFDDEATLPISIVDNNSFVFGDFIPQEPLSLFDGEDSNGVWTLSSIVNFNYGTYDSGSFLNQWCLVFNGSSDIPVTSLDSRFNCRCCGNLLTITDGATVSDTFNISNATDSITDLNIRRLDISHPFPEQLSISLTSPSGTTILLSSGNGSGATSIYERITLDDLALNSVTTLSGTTPFVAYFPEEALSAFNGETANGDWILTITDTVTSTAALSGTLDQWCLNFDGVNNGGD